VRQQGLFHKAKDHKGLRFSAFSSSGGFGLKSNYKSNYGDTFQTSTNRHPPATVIDYADTEAFDAYRDHPGQPGPGHPHPDRDGQAVLSPRLNAWIAAWWQR
jgi:hypothetical protein